jgi:hypothetical protein
MKQLIYFIIGKRAEGESLPQPTLKTTYPTDRPSENEWTKEFKFGSRYGHRGSFYHA